MTASEHRIPVDRKLHAFSRYVLSFLGAVGGVLLALWLVQAFTEVEGTGEKDVTWYVSGGLRLLTFACFAILSFLATLRSQPDDAVNGMARPRPGVVWLRVVAGICAALFFGDLAASAFAEQGGGWMRYVQAAILGVLFLAAVVSVATGRALNRLWKDSGSEDVPVWSEPTELAANKQVSSVGVHIVWLGVFGAAWIMSGDLPSLIGGDSEQMASLFGTLEGVMMGAVAAIQLGKREFVMSGGLSASTRHKMDMAMALFGVLLSAEVGARLIVGRAAVPWTGLWITGGVCFLGAVVAGVVVVRAMRGLSVAGEKTT